MDQLELQIPKVAPTKRDFVRGGVAAIVVAAFVFLGILAGLTLGNTNTTVNDLSHASTQHGETLTHIDRVATHVDSLAKEVKAEVAGLKTGNTTLSQLLVEAGTTASQLKTDQLAICAALHAGCPPG